jgi:hypothetical protein
VKEALDGMVKPHPEYKAMLKFANATVDQLQETSVEVGISPLMEELARNICAECVDLKVDEDVLIKYFQTLTALRVDIANREVKDPDWRQNQRHPWVLPVLFSVALAQIGVVHEVNSGITLRPFNKDEYALSVDECRRVSAQLNTITRYGYEVAREIPQTSAGNFDTMSVQLVEQVLRGRAFDPVHPVHAFLAAFLNARHAEALFSPTISYGSQASYKGFIYELGKGGTGTLLSALGVSGQPFATPTYSDKTSTSVEAGKGRERV